MLESTRREFARGDSSGINSPGGNLIAWEFSDWELTRGRIQQGDSSGAGGFPYTISAGLVFWVLCNKFCKVSQKRY